MPAFGYRSGCGKECQFWELNLCGNCHLTSCQQSQEYEIVGKYCPQCGKHSSKLDALYCYRNCFQCPRCTMFLQITSNRQGGSEMLRSYSFQCQGCGWSYCTPTVQKPKSLTKYIMELETQTEEYIRFEALQQHHHAKSILNKLSLKQGSLNFDSLDSRSLSSWWKRLANGEKIWELMDEELPVSSDTLGYSVQTLPLLCKLRPMFNYRCPYCKRSLMKMDPKSETIKWLKTSPPNRGIPKVSVISRDFVTNTYPEYDKSDRLVLLIENTRKNRDVTVTVNAEKSLHVPNRVLNICAVPETTMNSKDLNLDLEQLVGLTPTFQLNSPNAHKMVTAERNGRRGEFKGTETDNEMESLIDRGNGWVIIPIIIVGQKLKYELELLVHFDDWDINISAYINL